MVTREILSVIQHVINLDMCDFLDIVSISDKHIKIISCEGDIYSFIFSDNEMIKIFKYTDKEGKQRIGMGEYCFYESVMFIEDIAEITEIDLEIEKETKPKLRIVK